MKRFITIFIIISLQLLSGHTFRDKEIQQNELINYDINRNSKVEKKAVKKLNVNYSPTVTGNINETTSIFGDFSDEE